MERKKIKVEIELIEAMLGTVPKNKDIYKDFIQKKAREKGVDPQTLDNELEDIVEMEEKGWTGFRQDENGLYIYDYMMKGFLKESANIQKDDIKIKNFKSKMQQYVFVFPRKIYLQKTKPDGIEERPLRAMTLQGPRVSLARSDFVDAGIKFTIELVIFPNKEITEEAIRKVLDYGEFCGLGQFRSGSWGRFKYKILD